MFHAGALDNVGDYYSVWNYIIGHKIIIFCSMKRNRFKNIPRKITIYDQILHTLTKCTFSLEPLFLLNNRNCLAHIKPTVSHR